MTNKVIVTGGAGFLGTHLCRRLEKEGYTPLVIDLKENPEYQTIIADVRDKEKMMELIKDVNIVFHLAALIEAGESVNHPQAFIDTNLAGALHVMDAMKQNGVSTFIFSSTAAVYGEPQQVPISEDDRTLPVNPYGMTKLALEALLSSYVYSHGLTGIALRYFNLYGPEEHHKPETHVIPRFIDQVMNGNEVTVYGNGEHLRDYIHVADIVDAHIKAITYAEKNPNTYNYFNISTEKPASVMEIVKLIEKTLDIPANITHLDPRPGDPMKLYAKATKAKEVLGWEAKVDLEAGLKETVNYFKEL